MSAPSNMNTPYTKWKAVNTPMNARKIDENLVDMMRYAVHDYLDTDKKLGGTGSPCKPLDEMKLLTGASHVDLLTSVFLIEKTKTFKYGDGLEIMAFIDAGKNPVNGKETKYVKWFYFFENTDEQKIKKGFDGIMKENGKTYTYSVDKARTLWNEKIADGFKRINTNVTPVSYTHLTLPTICSV